MYLGNEVRVHLNDQAKEAFLELKKRNDKEAQILLRSIHRVIAILKENPQFGDPIRRQLIPQKLSKQGVQNLYRVELSNYWRMLYSITGTEVEIFCFVLNIMDHRAYDKLLGYRKF